MRSLVVSSMQHYWRMHLGILAGAILASAVLTGALLVGDSVDGSLRAFAVMRLGGIEHVSSTRTQFFDQALAETLDSELEAKATSVLHLRGMAINQGRSTGTERVQVNQVEVLGVTTDFWSYTDGIDLDLAPNEVAINEKLAAALGVQEGDEISIRVAKPALMSRDAPLSWSSDERSKRRTCIVKRVIADTELGRFSLSPSQVSPYNAFVSRDWLQEQVELEDKANLLLVGTGENAWDIQRALRAVWKPEYIGVKLRVYENELVQLESERIYLDPETARAAKKIEGAQPTLTYLVNSIALGDKATPYSFVVGGALADAMGDDETVINRWLADEIGVGLGDSIEMDYAELQPDGSFIDRQRSFKVRSIREMNTLQGELDLMPIFPGLSDAESCSDWDVGMPMDEDLRNNERNEVYWQSYGQTPKSFITLAAAQDMWSNRFGDMTSVRFPGGEETLQRVSDALTRETSPSAAGFVALPVRDQALQAVSEAMAFGGLFLGMSIFLIVAVLMLTGLLFAFLVQQRAPEMGVLLAMGFEHKTVRRLWLAEGFVIAALGSVLGAGLGALYTKALIYGLSTYWQGAIANAAIQFYATPTTMVMGAVISLLCALSAMWLTMRKQFRHPARELLTMDFTQEQDASAEGAVSKRGLILSISGFAAALAIIIGAQMMSVVELMIPFFGAGALLLMSGLGLFRYTLQAIRAGNNSIDMTLTRLALQNLARRRGRSLTVVALLACGCFMVFTVAAMQEDLQASAHHRNSGTGGYALLAESTFPILEDLLAALESTGASATGIKVRDGDDASCLNLNHAQSPRVLGVNVDDLVSLGAFTGDTSAESIWNLLNHELPDGSIPALVGDKNTAMWTLKKRTGVDKGDILIYQTEAGGEANIKLVGALPLRLSIFQGMILISEKHFTEIFPGEAGHRMFLIDASEEDAEEIATALTREFDRFGIDVMPAVNRLLEFYAVETTYLAMFLVLGGLGMAVGSIGMGVVVLRNLLERRREIAMLRALGFGNDSIYKMLLTEYSFLLVAGLLVGIVAAAVSTIPALLATDSNINLSIQFGLAALILVICISCILSAVQIGLKSSEISALRSE
jgi:ABC-type lipoprotein release transport system permease subunit